MRLIQLTPGAGAMYCGNCLRDNALVAAWRRLGHEALMVPLYLPITLDEPDQSAGTPIFFGGISVYLRQKSALFRNAPAWMHDLLASPRLLKWAGGRAAKTRPTDLGELTESMLRGEEGHQAADLEQLLGWLRRQPRPDVICLSNALLVGLARRLRTELHAPVACMLQGEDWFLDALPEPYRNRCWRIVAERAAELDQLIAPSRYFAALMRRRLGLPETAIAVVPNGIQLESYDAPPGPPPNPPVLGFFARMCREKGLHLLVAAYNRIRRRGRFPTLRLRVGGSCGPADQPLVEELKKQLAAEGLLESVEFHPNLDHAGKVAFLRSLSVFSVPAGYGEAFGLYVIEALAAGVPVVQPRSGAFPELVESTGGGLLCAPEDPEALAEGIEQVLAEPDQGRARGAAGRQAVLTGFSSDAMARGMLRALPCGAQATVSKPPIVK
jgi:glycosyltransferase involved in cell wall biosynthesis